MILKDITETIEVECLDIGNYIAEVEVDGRETDDSFSHEFGIEERKGVEALDATILSVLDDDGGEVRLTDEEERTVKMWAMEKFVEEAEVSL